MAQTVPITVMAHEAAFEANARQLAGDPTATDWTAMTTQLTSLAMHGAQIGRWLEKRGITQAQGELIVELVERTDGDRKRIIERAMALRRRGAAVVKRAVASLAAD